MNKTAGSLIVVVDDEQVLRDLFARVLSKAGYEVMTAADGPEAIKLCLENNVNLAVIDIKLPGMNGVQVLREIKRNRPGCEVIMITGYATLETAVESLKLGAYDYVRKPIDDIRGFTNMIHQAIERQKLIREKKEVSKALEENSQRLEKSQHLLLQAERLSGLGLLVAGVAHEINNPVGYVSSNLSTLDKYIASLTRLRPGAEKLKAAIVERKDLGKAAEALQEMAEIEKEANVEFIYNDIRALIRESQTGLERVAKIVSDLKGFSRAGAGKKMVPKDLNKIIEGVVNIVWNEIKYKAELKKEYGEIPLVRCDGQQLGQVFVNLLINAAQAIKGRGIITIRTYTSGSSVCVEIEDTGRGIPQEIRKRIFDPFFTAKGIGRGVGLGLSISYDIVMKHKGTIHVESQVGNGTKFIITLPNGSLQK